MYETVSIMDNPNVVYHNTHYIVSHNASQLLHVLEINLVVITFEYISIAEMHVR